MRTRTSALVAAVFLIPTAAFANISGFTGFAPANLYQGGVATPNGSLGYSLDGSTFNLTSSLNSQTTSGYFAAPQNISSFTATYTYTSIPTVYDPNSGSLVAANGLAFNFQNDPAGTALAADVNNADNLGIGSTPASASVAYNNFGGYLNFGGSTFIQTGGNVPGAADGAWKGIGPVNLSLGHPIQATVTYSNGTLRHTLTDTVTGDVYKGAAANLNIPGATGSSTAYVGFSATTGGFASTQNISNFTFTSGTGQAYSPVSPSAVFTPVAIASGFNKNVIVPASADPNAAITYINATPDNGTNVGLAGTGYTFFEQGLSGAPAGTGLPASGQTFVSQADSRHSFTMATYNTTPGGTDHPDSLVLNTNATSGSGQGTLSGTLTFATPTALSAISLLVSSGNGPVPLTVTVNYADGTSVDVGDAIANDWFFNPNPAFSAGARFDAANAAFDQSTGNVNLYQFDVGLPSSATAITSLTLGYDSSLTAGGVAEIFAVSGAPVSAVPEPAALSLVAFPALALLRRNRR